ncbi:hypothetical protein EHE19_007090 [Ruminiclostridium herbifermentans]|jgi:hypothetical protein|uniref:Uncharacterized protein n=1 Tax=Ruminiclostridium herbifermentans TaxID=2488810 RepID=A0A4U7JK71_9FIRM|nr:hypothetical protein [Ruminiclostridium herbifermentans]QNU68181.1 hypothetical protein EHE19_007090 [Ruminiclostridium herbifermentans]
MSCSSKFESFILSSMDNRIKELSNEYSNSAEYLEFYYLYNDIFNQIREALPSESSDLIDRLDSLHGSYLVGHQKFFYEQGFSDCRMLFNLLHK